jgi:hypothetical protein
MTRALIQMRRTTREEVCADVGKRGAFCVSVRSTAALIALARGDGDLPLLKPIRSAILLYKPPRIWRMSDQM